MPTSQVTGLGPMGRPVLYNELLDKERALIVKRDRYGLDEDEIEQLELVTRKIGNLQEAFLMSDERGIVHIDGSHLGLVQGAVEVATSKIIPFPCID